MEGLIRFFETGDILKSSLYYGIVDDCYFLFCPDKEKKNRNPTFTINLVGSQIKLREDKKYNLDMIEIIDAMSISYLISSYDPNNFYKWYNFLKARIEQYNTTYPSVENNSKKQSLTSNPVPKPRSNHMDSNYGESRRRSNQSNSIYTSHNEPSTRPRKQSRQSLYSYQSRPIDTVKEDPSMADEDVLETKSIDHLRKKFPIADQIKRWSIAATDLIGKSNEELYIMLIQLNRHKADMDVWKEHIDIYIQRIDEELEDNLRPEVKAELQENRANLLEELEELEFLLNSASPLIEFLESVVQMSDIYGGDNQTFHMVYHDVPPTGDENLDNIEFMRHNQERQIAKMLDEMKLGTVSDRHKFSLSDGRQGSSRFNTLQSNHSANDYQSYMVMMTHSDTYLTNNRQFQLIIDDIETDFLRIQPVKSQLEIDIKSIDAEIDLYREQLNNPRQSIVSKDSMSLSTIQYQELQVQRHIQQQQEQPITLAQLKQQNMDMSKPKQLSPNDLQPRRSTRKKPMSDMTSSLNRAEYYKRSNVPLASLNVPLMNQGDYLSSSMRNRDKKFVQSPSQQRKKLPANPSNNSSVKSSSKLSAQLMQVLNTEPMSNPPAAPFIHSRIDNSHVNNNNNNDENNNLSNSINRGPLFKLDASRYNSMHRSKGSSINKLNDEDDDNRNNNHSNQYYRGDHQDTKIQTNAPDELSLDESDVSLLAHNQTDINQRLNLNECYDEAKSWKSPSAKLNHNTSPQDKSNFHNYMMDESDNNSLSYDSKVDRIINTALSIPDKVEIKERYNSSDVEENYDPSRSMKMRKLLANENRSTNPRSGDNKEFEKELMKRSLLAQEASRRSRNL